MKKFLALLLTVCVCFAVLVACEGDETFVGDGTDTQVGDGDTQATESTGGDDSPEAGDSDADLEGEQTFGGLQELKPLN